MGEDANERRGTGAGFDPLIQTENIAFDRDSLVACAGCGRLNPPNRLKCLYCAQDLNLSTEHLVNLKPNLRRLEAWEHGFNVILREQTSEVNCGRAAELLSMETSELSEILQLGVILPLARVETEKGGEMLQLQLMDTGLKCTLIKDAELDADTLPTRVRGLDFRNDQLTIIDFNTGKTNLIGHDEIALIIQGYISKSKVDSNEKKRRGTDAKLIDQYATVSDESVIDIYTFADKTGFRIYPAGFDFSCLREQKTLLARDNFGRLVNMLIEHCPKARLVSNYSSIRQALGHVWEIESRKDSLGLRQVAIGKREFGSIASTSNLSQFTKFSRLQWHLL